MAPFESLAHIGTGADRDVLTRISRTNRDSRVRIWAVRTLEAEELLSSPRFEDRLIEAVLKEPSRAPLFNGSEWALEKIVALILTSAVEPLRRCLDRPGGIGRAVPAEASERFRLRVPGTIDRLGGPLTGAELELLEENPPIR